MWELDYEESWVLKNWCFWTVVLEKTVENPLDSEEIQPVYPEGNQFWIFIGRTDAEAETPLLWPPDGKNRPIWKDPDAGKVWRWEEKETTWWDCWWHHRRDEHEFEWWTGKPGFLKSLGSQRVGYTWVTELNWTGDEKSQKAQTFSYKIN